MARRKRSLLIPAAFAATLLLGTSAPAAAGSRLEEAANRGWIGLASVTCSTVYAPIKVFVGGSGLIVGASAWILTAGADEPALTILERTLGGDWLVTSDHLTGDRDFAILGPPHGGRVAAH